MENVRLTRVLIVDDDVDMTEVLTMILREAGFEVLATNSSVAGVEASRSWKPDVVILDLIMPGMDGWETCRAIRETSQVPILVLSVINKPEMIAKALDQGADDHLVKPVPSGVLIAHLNNLARRSRRPEMALNGVKYGLK
jgi:DNA-binding response OmpR family regulator